MDFLRLNRRCCGISPPVLAFPTNSCPVITRRSVIQVPAPPPMSRGAILWGGENLLRPAGHADVFLLAGRGSSAGIIRPPRARFDFYQARSSWSRAEWIGAGRMAIDGLKEVQESVMRIEAGLSTYEKELALMGEDYQDIFRQQVRESAEREKPDSHVRCG